MDKSRPGQITVGFALSSYHSWSTVLDFAHPVIKTATLATLGKAGRTTSAQPAAPGLPVLSASGQDRVQPQGSTQAYPIAINTSCYCLLFLVE